MPGPLSPISTLNTMRWRVGADRELADDPRASGESRRRRVSSSACCALRTMFSNRLNQLLEIGIDLRQARIVVAFEADAARCSASTSCSTRSST